jgi:hypothetical protein
MTDYIMTCISGAIVLVSADSAAEAEADWDLEVGRYFAEPRIPGTTTEASEDDIAACEESGHDYR